ncbi:MAG TPA: M15 family metallopeptidase [Myxococcaceae bacterium]|nr:M15 family metallopeptidase [Myxococcaceae bacterium]
MADVNDLLIRLDLQMINPDFLARIRDMLAACRAAGADYWATSGYRSPADQDVLYAQGRTKPGNVVTAAQGFQSAHNFGLAIDFTKDSDAAKSGLQPAWSAADYEMLGQQAVAHGLVWGGDWKTKDRPHVQYPGYVSATELDPLKACYQGAAVTGADAKAKDLCRLQAVWASLAKLA